MFFKYLKTEGCGKYFGTIKHAKARIEAYVKESFWQLKISSSMILNLRNGVGNYFRFESLPFIPKERIEKFVASAERKGNSF
jgi:hypothetical protein